MVFGASAQGSDEMLRESLRQLHVLDAALLQQPTARATLRRAGHLFPAD
jgi:hypothetical protein